MDDLVPRVIAGSLTYRNGDPMQDGNTAVIKSEDLRALCDRLILYREARDQVEQVISAWAFAHNIDGALRNDLFERLRRGGLSSDREVAADGERA